MLGLLTNQNWIYKVIRHGVLFISMVLIFSWVAHARAAGDSSFFHSLLMVSLNALVFFGYGYLTIYFLIPHYLARRKAGIFFFLFIASGILLSGLKFMFSDYLFYMAISHHEPLSLETTLRSLLVNTKDMTFIVAVFAIVKYARDRYLLEINIRELEQKGMEAELNLLEHQMDPHVIFNNFNNLYSISINRPDLLGATVKSMMSILRYLFQESKNTLVPLENELQMIKDYIGLEKLRYGERLKIHYSQEGDTTGLKVAPLILYPFVENCFVHGAGEEASDAWIDIRVRIEQKKLWFYAANSVSANASVNSIRRLELQYPNSHRIAITERVDKHAIDLNLRL